MNEKLKEIEKEKIEKLIKRIIILKNYGLNSEKEEKQLLRLTQLYRKDNQLSKIK